MKTPRYATPADFCRIFEKDMNRLYLLSFLLTGDHSLAEKCFVQGLETSSQGNSVFKEWAESWARRTIIRKAIQMIHPSPTDGIQSSATSENSPEPCPIAPRAITDIVALPSFDRFAFVISALEGCSDKQCSLLLNCSRADAAAGRIRAMQQLGNSASVNPDALAA